jgi:hypothetical protein
MIADLSAPLATYDLMLKVGQRNFRDQIARLNFLCGMDPRACTGRTIGAPCRRVIAEGE